MKVTTMDPKVLLVNPSFDLESHFGRLAKAGPSLLPVGSTYLAAVLENSGIDVSIWDGQVEPAGLDSLEEALRSFRPTVVGITAYSPMLAQVRAVARLSHSELPQSIVVVGGVHATVLPDEILNMEEIDVVVRGEAEPVIVPLVESLTSGGSIHDIPGISIRRNGAKHHAPPIALVEDLDTIPKPSLHLLKHRLYRPAPEITMTRPSKIQSIITSRGCPYQCIFCSARLLSGRRYRYHSPARVMEEIESVIADYDAREIVFLDDNFIVNKKRVYRICDELIKSGLSKRLIWACNGRVDEVDQDMLFRMREAGCRLISFGVESGVERLLKLIKKDITLEDSMNAVRWAKRAGIRVRTTLIIGLPTETVDETRKTIEFAKKLGSDFAKFSLATPYPGTELCQIAEARGLMKSHDWSRASSMVGFSTYDPLFTPEGRTGEEMKQWQRKAMREFYIRPRQLWNVLSQTKSLADVRLLLEAARAMIQ